MESSEIDYPKFHRALLMLLASCGIAVLVWVLFEIGAEIGLQWYVSATAILLGGIFLIVRI